MRLSDRDLATLQKVADHRRMSRSTVIETALADMARRMEDDREIAYLKEHGERDQDDDMARLAEGSAASFAELDFDCGDEPPHDTPEHDAWVRQLREDERAGA